MSLMRHGVWRQYLQWSTGCWSRNGSEVMVEVPQRFKTKPAREARLGFGDAEGSKCRRTNEELEVADQSSFGYQSPLIFTEE